MRAAIVWLALAACRIPTENYISGNPSDGKVGDGTGNGDALHDTMSDAPPPPHLSKGYIFDTTSGIWRVNKNAAGALTLAAPTALPAGTTQGGVASMDGKNLYVLDSATPSLIHTFVINSDGTLTAGLNFGSNCATPRYATVSPIGNFLAVACTQNQLMMFPIETGNGLGTTMSITIGTNPVQPVFTPNGNCLYLADLNGPGTTRIWMLEFDPVNQNWTTPQGFPGPATPHAVTVHPNGQFLYVAGEGNGVQAYGIAANCGLSQLGPNLPVGGNTQLSAVDGAGKFLFVSGTEVYVFAIAPDGMLTAVPGNPFLETGTTIDDITTDPALEDTLYITGRGYMGTEVIAVDPGSGALTVSSSVSTMTGGDQWLTFAQ